MHIISRKPKIRFNNFNDNWNLYTLGNIGEIKTGPFGSVLHADDYVDDGMPIITTEHFKNGDLPISKNGLPQVSESDYYRLNSYALKVGDIVFSRVGSVDINALVTSIQDNWLFSGRVLRVRVNKNIDSKYLHYELATKEVKKDVTNRAVGLTMPSINTEILKETQVFAPAQIGEQQNIGMFLNALDFLINYNQSKYMQLVNMKSSLLEKMFPHDGAKVPEIRLSGYDDVWEEQKIGEVFELVTDYVAAGSFADLAKNVQYRNAPDYAQLVRTMDLKNKFTSSECIFVDKNAFDFLYRVNLNKASIILPNIGNCGEVYYTEPQALPYPNNVLGPNAILLRSDTFDNKFLSILLQGKDFQKKLSLIISPNGQTKFNKTELKEITILMPNNAMEQKKISDIFFILNRIIDLQQRKIEQLKNIKQSFLDKMFVS